MRDRAKLNYTAPFVTCLACIALFAGALVLLVQHNPPISIQTFDGRVELGIAAVTLSHPTGGILDRIEQQTGDWAEQGQVLVQLDDTALAAAHKLTEDRLWTARIRLARLEAERDGASGFTLPENQAAPPAVIPVVDRQTALLKARAQTREARLGQLGEEIAYLKAQLETAQAIVAPDPEIVAELREDLSRAEAAQNQILADFEHSIETEIAKVAPSLTQLEMQFETSAAQLAALSIEAPIAGTVRLMDGLKLGDIIPPETPILEVLPAGAEPVVRFLVPAGDIAEIVPGQSVEVWSDAQTDLLPGRVTQMERPTTEDTPAELTVTAIDPQTWFSKETPVRVVVTTDLTELLEDLAVPLAMRWRGE